MPAQTGVHSVVAGDNYKLLLIVLKEADRLMAEGAIASSSLGKIGARRGAAVKMGISAGFERKRNGGEGSVPTLATGEECPKPGDPLVALKHMQTYNKILSFSTLSSTMSRYEYVMRLKFIKPIEVHTILFAAGIYTQDFSGKVPRAITPIVPSHHSATTGPASWSQVC